MGATGASPGQLSPFTRRGLWTDSLKGKAGLWNGVNRRALSMKIPNSDSRPAFLNIALLLSLFQDRVSSV